MEFIQQQQMLIPPAEEHAVQLAIWQAFEVTAYYTHGRKRTLATLGQLLYPLLAWKRAAMALHRVTRRLVIVEA